MKNIYNLITDAFTRIGKDETKYSITIEYTEFTLRSYGIRIMPLEPVTGSEATAASAATAATAATAAIVLLLNSSDQLIDYYEMNDLFDDLSWQRFCDVFEWQM